uniref:Uncharacterized protein n=1 Tax=Picea sitchensis TaxID=3332 RepID=D5ACN3_PICSI|nr:unknown [Picea sitchensis]
MRSPHWGMGVTYGVMFLLYSAFLHCSLTVQALFQVHSTLLHTSGEIICNYLFC